MVDAEETPIRLHKADAKRRGLISLLSLKEGKKSQRAYIADVARPSGAPTIMEVYRIVEETQDAYLVKEVTLEEMKRLSRKYNQTRGNSFSVSYRSSQRE